MEYYTVVKKNELVLYQIIQKDFYEWYKQETKSIYNAIPFSQSNDWIVSIYVSVWISNVDIGLYEYGENMEDTQQVIKVDHVGMQHWVGGMRVTVRRESDKEKQ